MNSNNQVDSSFSDYSDETRDSDIYNTQLDQTNKSSQSFFNLSDNQTNDDLKINTKQSTTILNINKGESLKSANKSEKIPEWHQDNVTSNVVSFIKKILQGNLKLILAANICILITSSIQAFIPKLCGNLIDSFSNKSKNEENSYSFFFFFILIVISTIFAFLRGFLFEYLSEKVIFKLKFYFFTEVIYNKVSFFENNKSGELMSRFTSDLGIIKNGLSDNICMLIRSVIQLIVSLILIFYLNFSLALCLIFIILPSVYTIINIAKRMKNLTKDYNQVSAESVAILSENFLNMKVIKSFNAEPFEINKYCEKNYEAFNYGKRRAFIFGLMLAFINTIAFGIILFVLYYGGTQVANGEVTVGELSSFFLYSTTLSFSLMSLSSTVGQIITTKSTLEKILELINKHNSELYVIDNIGKRKLSGSSSCSEKSEVKNVDQSSIKQVYHYSKIIDYNTLINEDHIFSHNYLEEKVIKAYLTPRVVKPIIDLRKGDDEENKFLDKKFNNEEQLKFILQRDGYDLNSFLEKSQNNDPVEVDDFTEAIEFRNVSFQYKKSNFTSQTEVLDKETDLDTNYVSDNLNPVALKNINLIIPKKTKIAIVGESGSGKSTLISLILKYYSINSGEILFDGVNLDSISCKSLRNLVSYVHQEPAILSGTLLSNILFGIEQCNESELEEALEIANCSFVKDKSIFPQGLKTIVGEKGVRLSGGQKQRISIARAILKDPKIFIFDEATASLDSASEELVQTAVDNVVKKKNCTAIIISHRLSTIKNCDKIVVIKSGEIIAQGTHEELICKFNNKLKFGDLAEKTKDNEYLRIFEKQMNQQ